MRTAFLDPVATAATSQTHGTSLPEIHLPLWYLTVFDSSWPMFEFSRSRGKRSSCNTVQGKRLHAYLAGRRSDYS